MPAAFRCSSLTKAWPGFRLGPLDLELELGVTLGLVGLNGSGKTTTMNCMAGLLRPDSGRVEVCGRVVDAADPLWKQGVALVTHRPPFYEKWTVSRNLALLSRAYRAWSPDTAAGLCRRFDLDCGARVCNLSRGSRTKLAIVAALSASPRLLLLDEPTAGLDPVVRDDVLDVLYDLVERGDCALLYSTHIVSDISRLADELAFLADGQVVLRQAVADLTERWRTITFRYAGDPACLQGVVDHQSSGDEHRVVTCNGAPAVARLSEIGGEHVRSSPMGVDEIAVHILRGGYHVAAG